MSSNRERTLLNRRFTSICFTLNNPTVGERQLFNLMTEDGATRKRLGVMYLCYQMEVGETGTRHLQGYLEFTGRPRGRAIKTKINQRMHFERRRGTQEQAIAYCRKAESRAPGCMPMEGGTPRIIGRSGRPKNKTKNLAKDLNDGMNLVDVEGNYPALYLMQKEKIIARFLELQGKRDWAMKVLIYVGKTGTGKSYSAKSEYPGAYHVPWPVGGRWWWPDYKGEETIILDEFRHQVKYDVMLKLLDRHPFIIEWKGGNSQMVSRNIVITSNIDPKDWYPGMSREKKEPLRRRIQEFATIWDFNDNNEYPNFVRELRDEPFMFNEQFVIEPDPDALVV